MMPTLLEVSIVYLPARSLVCEIAEPIVTAKVSPIELCRLHSPHPNSSQTCSIRVSPLQNLGNLQNLWPLGTGAEKLSWMTQNHRESWQAQILCTVRSGNGVVRNACIGKGENHQCLRVQKTELPRAQPVKMTFEGQQTMSRVEQESKDLKQFLAFLKSDC